MKTIAVIGVPSSAGAHHAGQDLAPAALRAAGLTDRLGAGGREVVDTGDVRGAVFRVDPDHPTTRSVGEVVRVALDVADAVEREVRLGRFPLVLGGDCTISLGVVAGLQRVEGELRLAYFDGDADLNAPERTRSGVLDATGVAHLLGIARSPLASIGAHEPMLRPEQLALVGYDRTDPDSFDQAALDARPGLLHFSDAETRDDPDGVVAAVREGLTAEGATIAVHFDVDSIDSGDLPLANFPHYGTGVPLATAGVVLRGLLAMPGVASLTLTEVNPTHDPDGGQLARYIDTVVAAFGA